MAFGLSPHYKEEISFENLTKTEFLVLAIEAAKALGWNVSFISTDGFIAYTKFSLTSYSEEVQVKISEDSALLKSECTGSQLVDWGKNKRNVRNFISTFNEVSGKLSPEEINLKFEALQPEMASADSETLNQPLLSSKEKVTSFFYIFKPTEGYFVTPILIILNIAVFALMAFSGTNILSPEGEDLIRWGANFRPVTLNGEGWRLFTSCFLHIGIFHLLLNMYGLLYIGLLLEPYLGKLKFLSAYILTGILASATSLWWHNYTISAGASGAIFGMYGVFLALLTTNVIDKSVRKALLTSMLVFVGYNLVNGLKGGIDNAAHIGGLVSGLIIGYAFYPVLKKPTNLKLKFGTLALLTLSALIVSVLTYKTTPNGLATYDEKMQRFYELESLALEAYRVPEDAPKEKILYEIKDRGLYFWKEGQAILLELQESELPEELNNRNEKMLAYCNLRIKSYNLAYKAINEDTDKYKDSLDYYHQELETLLQQNK